MLTYNASKILEPTCSEIPCDVVNYLLLVDDFINDDTVVRASQLNIQVQKHDENIG